MINKEKLFFIIIMSLTLIMWASAFTAIRVALDSFKPESLALMRFLVASGFLFIYGLFKKFSLPDLKDVPIILISGFLGISLYHVALNYGETLISAGSASMIVNTYPIFVAILSTVLLKEYVNLTKWTGILISFAGIAIIAFGESGGLSLSSGAFLVLIAAISNSLYDVIQKKLLKKYTPLELTSYFIWAGTFFLMIFSPSLFTDIKLASFNSILSVLYLGIFPGAIAYLIWSKALSKSSITNISSLLYILPILAVIIAFFYLKEIPAFISLVGGLVVLVGVIIINFHEKVRQIVLQVADSLHINPKVIKRQILKKK